MPAETATCVGEAFRRNIVFGSRKSKLAPWQTNQVARQIAAAFPHVETSVQELSTKGDENIDQPLPEIGGKGLFTAELDLALARGEIDVAVHSLKDLPTQQSSSITVLPVLAREDPRDVLISTSGQTLGQLPAGAIVGTSSYRRQSQLLAIRRDLEIRSIRGNVPTRISKVWAGEYDAVVLAAAGVIRVGHHEAVHMWFSLKEILPAPGQGIIAATCRSSDTQMISVLKSLQDRATTVMATAERAFLTALGGGCSAPIAAHCRALDPNGNELELTGRVGTIDGSRIVTEQLTGSNAEDLAAQLGAAILKKCPRQILQEIKNS
jgi:hydroxymethylbilane synthase